MKILVVGSGGREHALAWKLANDSTKPHIYCAPGNAGTAGVAQNVAIDPLDMDGLLAWARANRPDLTVIGPEAPLCEGLTDRLEAEGLQVFGPCRAAARIEGSKAFAKDIMCSAGVPTARSANFSDLDEACAYVMRIAAPMVVKADGLAAGKGVFVCATRKEALAALERLMLRGELGQAGGQVVIEEFLEGEEASILALTDGEHIVMLASSQDHKRAYDGDKGPNTGGMGAYSPAPVVTDAVLREVRQTVLEPTLAELRRRGILYRGVLYAGLMIHHGACRVLEFNCRFGDPETQAVLPRIDGDLLPALLACCDGTLSEDLVSWRDESSVYVVMASGGYPGTYSKGLPVSGIDAAASRDDVLVLHAGTALKDGRVLTDGGRVLGVVGLGQGLPGAVNTAYAALADIRFDGAMYRRDIGYRALNDAALPRDGGSTP